MAGRWGEGEEVGEKYPPDLETCQWQGLGEGKSMVWQGQWPA